MEFMLRRSVPLAARLVTVAGQRFRCVSGAGAGAGQRFDSVPSGNDYSGSPEKKLLREAIEAEIGRTLKSNKQEQYWNLQAVEVPEGFPFVFIVHPSDDFITLERQYNGHTVEVRVEKSSGGSSSLLSLVVKLVNKRVAERGFTDFQLTCTVFPDRITIDDHFIAAEMAERHNYVPHLRDFSEILQKAFHEYLESMGINMTTANFLHKYLTSYLMVNQRDRRDLNWFNLLKKNFLSSLPQRPNLPQQPNADQNYSALEKFLEVIEAEIRLTLESNKQEEAVEAPKDFPFKIEAKPWEDFVTLVREYDGEAVTAEVLQMDRSEPMYLTVKVANKNGAKMVFSCTAKPYDKITINQLNATSKYFYSGPLFRNMSTDLQKAFHEYLESRGMTLSTTNFLSKYMANHLMMNTTVMLNLNWLQELDNFLRR